MPNEKVFYGENNCEKINCQNKAYFSYQNKYFCGVHSRKFSNKIKLVKRSKTDSLKRKQEISLSQKSEIEQARTENEASNRKGNVICCQLKMMKQPKYLKGYLNVFPNFKHQNRTDGFGCASLSPMSLGPVVIFNKEVAKNLENFHQGSKCFDCETDKKGEPSEVFFKNQASFLADIIPHRHKFKSANKTKYFVWKDEFDKLHKLNYIESRQFYCNLYERLASETNDFQTLKSLIKTGLIFNYVAMMVEK